MKRFFALFCILSLLLPLCACANDELSDVPLGGIHTEAGDVYPEEFLVLDGKEVSFDEFRYFYLNYKTMYVEEDENYFQNGQNEKELKEEVLQYLLDRRAVEILAKKERVSLSAEEKKGVLQEIENTRAGYESEEAFLNDLHASFLSLTFYQDMLEYSALYLKLFDKLYRGDGKRAYSEEEFFAYFRENYLAVQEIFLPFEEGETKENCPKTLSLAESIRGQTESTPFWDLIEQYGKDENMLNYPDGYYIKSGQAEDVLFAAAKELEIEGISQPVVGETGVYLLKRLELKELRMNENRESALFGYRDSFDVWHGGAYDEDFYRFYREKAGEIEIETPAIWEKISTESVF